MKDPKSSTCSGGTDPRPDESAGKLTPGGRWTLLITLALAGSAFVFMMETTRRDLWFRDDVSISAQLGDFWGGHLAAGAGLISAFLVGGALILQAFEMTENRQIATETQKAVSAQVKEMRKQNEAMDEQARPKIFAYPEIIHPSSYGLEINLEEKSLVKRERRYALVIVNHGGEPAYHIQFRVRTEPSDYKVQTSILNDGMPFLAPGAKYTFSLPDGPHMVRAEITVEYRLSWDDETGPLITQKEKSIWNAAALIRDGRPNV